MRRAWTTVFMALLAIGCGKDDKAGGGEPAGKAGATGKSKAADFVTGRLKENLAEAKAELGRGEPSGSSCAAIGSYADQVRNEPSAKELVAEADQVCGFDVPFFIAEREVKAAEAARQGKAPTDVVSECFNADWKTARATLDKSHAADPKVAELQKRWDAACPPK